VFGLAFKENTDDLRESPVVTMIEHLLGKGRDLRVYDPHIVINQIYGSNKNYVLNAVPHIGKLMAASLDELLESCQSLIVTQKASAEALEKIRASGVRLLDVASI
jgi:GDP-mannose 6-dehydrogenase